MNCRRSVVRGYLDVCYLVLFFGFILAPFGLANLLYPPPRTLTAPLNGLEGVVSEAGLIIYGEKLCAAMGLLTLYLVYPRVYAICSQIALIIAFITAVLGFGWSLVMLR